MEKHINNQQEEMIIEFMEKHTQLAKGFAKGDRIEIEKLWQTLSDILNSIGPPLKKPDAWKKAWSDKKTQIKKKLAKNKMESRATGGEPHNQLYISERDEAIARLCGLYDIVDDIDNSVSYGFQREEENIEQSLESTDSTEEEVHEDQLPTTSTLSKKRKVDNHSLQYKLKKFMADESYSYAAISSTLTKLQNTLEGNKAILKSLDCNTRRMQKALERLSDHFKESIKATNDQTEELIKQRLENDRHHKELEKLA